MSLYLAHTIQLSPLPPPAPQECCLVEYLVQTDANFLVFSVVFGCSSVSTANHKFLFFVFLSAVEGGSSVSTANYTCFEEG